MHGNVGLINSITRVEHTFGIPAVEDTIEGLKCAKAVAHMINLERFEAYKEIDKSISNNRATKKTCIINGGIFHSETIEKEEAGCIRCDAQCPLKILNAVRP
jgi:thiamine biosynthesis protein ThiC